MQKIDIKTYLKKKTKFKRISKKKVSKNYSEAKKQNSI